VNPPPFAEGAHPVKPTIDQHFADRSPHVRAIYDRLLAAARRLGPFTEDPKKTSIHLTRSSAFAGVATRKDALILTLKSPTDIRSPRIVKRQQASSRRWYLEVKLDDPKQVDAELTGWLKRAFELGEKKPAA
jgi:hypothetical protein